MFTKDQLAKWRAEGFEFDSFYDGVAVDKKKDNVSILSITVVPKQAQESRTQFFTVLIQLTGVLTTEKLSVEIDSKIFQAYQRVNLFGQEIGGIGYYADISVDIPTPYSEKVFKLTANLSEVVNNKVLKSKSINVSVNEDGEIGITDKETDLINDQPETKDIVGCGIEFRNKIKCTRYSKKYGPVYFGNIKMSEYSNWNDIVNSGKISDIEKDIIIAMSQNEGNLDAVNAYDDQIVTIGAMQKTISPEGYGELPIQIWEFKLDYPEKYNIFLERCGWKVEEEVQDKNGKSIPARYRMYYNNISGKALYNLIRENCNKDNYGKSVKSIPLEPLINLCNNIDFQGKQLTDFIQRLNDSIQKKPKGYSQRINKFVKSKLGMACVLDQDVNRPAHVSLYFGASLDILYKNNTLIPKNPDDWGDNHKEYENKLLDIYGPLRGKKIDNVKYPMTDAGLRYNNLKSKLK